MKQKNKREKHYFKDRKSKATKAKIQRKADKYSTHRRRVAATLTDRPDVKFRRIIQYRSEAT